MLSEMHSAKETSRNSALFSIIQDNRKRFEYLKQGEMNQEENPLWSIKPEKLVAWLYHWSSSYNDCPILDLLSHFHYH